MKGKDLNKRLKELRDYNMFGNCVIPGIGMREQIRQSNIRHYNRDLIKNDLEQWLKELE